METKRERNGTEGIQKEIGASRSMSSQVCKLMVFSLVLQGFSLPEASQDGFDFRSVLRSVLGSILGGFLGVLGTSWDVLGRLGASRSVLGAFWARLLRPLGRSWR